MDLLLFALLLLAMLAVAGGVWLNPLIFVLLALVIVVAVASRGRYR